VRWVDQIKPTASAIRIARTEKYGVPSVHVCDLCAGRQQQECVAICPVEALRLEDGVVRGDWETCTQCMNCVEACPQEAIALDEARCRIILCDLCGGEPLCVAWCAEDALSLQEVIE
jgi:Fe-S-cluster-containing hydrogenase component 2